MWIVPLSQYAQWALPMLNGKEGNQPASNVRGMVDVGLLSSIVMMSAGGLTSNQLELGMEDEACLLRE